MIHIGPPKFFSTASLKKPGGQRLHHFIAIVSGTEASFIMMIGEQRRIKELTIGFLLYQNGSINKSYLFTFYQTKLVKWPNLIVRELRNVEKQIFGEHYCIYHFSCTGNF